MPPKKHQPDPENQGVFFEHVTEHAGEVVGHTLKVPEDGVAYDLPPAPLIPKTTAPAQAPQPPEQFDTKEYFKSQVEALQYLGKISRKAGLKTKAETDPEHIRGRKGSVYDEDALAAVVAESDLSRSGDAKLAFAAFARGFGGAALSETVKGKALQDVDPQLASAYREFLRRYSGPGEAAKVRARQVRKLTRIIDTFDAPDALPRFNPKKVKVEIIKPRLIPADPTEIVPPKLTHSEKVEAILGDYRAGFYTATNSEKAKALEALDYLNPSHYRGGIHEQLMGIHDRQIKNGRTLKVRDPIVEGEEPPQPRKLSMNETRAMADDAVRSVLYTYGDFRANARWSFTRLEEIEQAILACDNPSLTLAEMLAEPGNAQLDLRPLIRYFDLVEYQELTPEEQKLRRTMVTLEDRSDPTPEKHKTVEDRYTRKEMDEMMLAYIDLRKSHIQVGDARRVVGSAKRNEWNRGALWTQVLSSVRFTYRGLAQQVLEATD